MGRTLSKRCLTRLDLGVVADVGHLRREKTSPVLIFAQLANLIGTGMLICQALTCTVQATLKVPSRSPTAAQGSSSSTALVGHRHGTNKSLARYLTEGLWCIVEMAGYQPLPYRWE